MKTYENYISHLQQEGFDLDVVAALRKAYEEQYNSLIQALRSYTAPAQTVNWIVDFRSELEKLRESLNLLLRRGDSHTPETDVQMNDAFKYVCRNFLGIIAQTKQLARLDEEIGSSVLVAGRIVNSGRI